jgi:hypothetical protein
LSFSPPHLLRVAILISHHSHTSFASLPPDTLEARPWLRDYLHGARHRLYVMDCPETAHGFLLKDLQRVAYVQSL